MQCKKSDLEIGEKSKLILFCSRRSAVLWSICPPQLAGWNGDEDRAWGIHKNDCGVS